jgi:hypothetical protein
VANPQEVPDRRKEDRDLRKVPAAEDVECGCRRPADLVEVTGGHSVIAGDPVQAIEHGHVGVQENPAGKARGFLLQPRHSRWGRVEETGIDDRVI